MSLFDLFKKPDEDILAQRAASVARVADMQKSLASGTVPAAIKSRIEGARNGSLPWMASLTPAELLIVRSHGLKPIATISATCWLHYGWSWTRGPSEGWMQALRRLEEEAY